MPKPANYFRIGLFILLALAILVGGLIIFGAGQFFKKKIVFETYEQGTVQGIDVGSPVKFRGVQIGQVTWVGFSFNTYPRGKTNNEDNYVIIRMEVDREIFPHMFREDLRPLLEKGVKDGLRVRIEPQGITGTNYIEINYVQDPSQFPLIAFDWTPRYYYIPSAPGELTDMLDSMNKMMHDLEKLNLGDIQGGLSQLLKNFNQTLTDAQIGKLSADLQTLIVRLNTAITEANLGPLSDDARGLMAGLQKSNDQLQKILQNVEPATHFNPEDVKILMRNLATISQNLNTFSQAVKDHPHLLLYGEPPAAPSPTPPPRRRH